MFLTLGGVRVGFQIGGTATDTVMGLCNPEGFLHLLSDKFKIGENVSGAAGPAGRNASAATGLEMYAEILGYSRSRGVFASLRLDGAVVQPGRSGDRAFYGNSVDREAVLDGKVPIPAQAWKLVDEIQHYASAKG